MAQIVKVKKTYKVTAWRNLILFVNAPSEIDVNGFFTKPGENGSTIVFVHLKPQDVELIGEIKGIVS